MGDTFPPNDVKPSTGFAAGRGRSNFHCQLYVPDLLNAFVRGCGVREMTFSVPSRAVLAISNRLEKMSQKYEAQPFSD